MPKKTPFDHLIGKPVCRKIGGKTTTIKAVHSDILGGCILEDELEGFKQWNITDLAIVETIDGIVFYTTGRFEGGENDGKE